MLHTIIFLGGAWMRLNCSVDLKRQLNSWHKNCLFVGKRAVSWQKPYLHNCVQWLAREQRVLHKARTCGAFWAEAAPQGRTSAWNLVKWSFISKPEETLEVMAITPCSRQGDHGTGWCKILLKRAEHSSNWLFVGKNFKNKMFPPTFEEERKRP